MTEEKNTKHFDFIYSGRCKLAEETRRLSHNIWLFELEMKNEMKNCRIKHVGWLAKTYRGLVVVFL